MNKTSKMSTARFLLLLAVLFIGTTGAWSASTVTITKQINGDGIGAENPGDVTYAIADGVCTLTVTPADGFYAGVDNITAVALVSGNVAQGSKRTPGINEGTITVTATNSSADPSGETTYTFTMPTDESIVEVTVDFQYRTDLSLLEGTVIELAYDTQTYTGSALEPAVVSVTIGSELALTSADYTVAYSDNTNVGTATVTLTGKGAYKGSVNTTFTITPAAPTVVTAPAAKTLTYTGAAQALVTAGEATNGSILFSTDNKNFSATIPTGTNAGSYTVYFKVEGSTDNYSDIASTQITGVSIAQAAMSGVTIAAVDAQTFTGSAITPEPAVTFGTTTLTKGTDFTYSYADNTNVGTATITVTAVADGNFTGSKSTTFNIAAAAPTVVTAPAAATPTYTGAAQALVTAGEATNGTILFSTDNVNFSETIPTGSDAGSYTVYYKVKGNTNYSDIASTQITGVSIAQAAMSGVTIAAVASQTFTGSAITPEPAVTFGTTTLTKGTDFTYSYADNTEAGTATITVTAVADGNFTGSKGANFTITGKNISAATISAIADQTYTGSALTPDFTVTDGEVTLTKGEDYTVEYSNNTAVGVATVTITGAGNYTGTKNATFNILMEVNVTFTEGRTWGTYVSANTNLTVPTGLKAYAITSVSGSTVSVEEIGYIPAGSAVLLEKTGDEVGSTAGLYDGEVSSEITNLLKATTAATAVSSIEGGTVYVLYNNEFRRTTSGTIPANRGYLLLDPSTAEIAGASLMIIDDEDVTAISNDKVAAPKAGQAQWYTLDGRKLTGKPAGKGLYIYNGRTVVVK